MAAALLPRMEDEREVAVRSIRTTSSDDAVGSLLASDDMVGLLLGQRMEGCVRVGVDLGGFLILDLHIHLSFT